MGPRKRNFLQEVEGQSQQGSAWDRRHRPKAARRLSARTRPRLVPAVSTRKMHPLLPIKDKPPDGSREEQDAASDEGSRPFGPSEPRVKGDSQKGDAVDERVRRRGLPRLEELRCDSGHMLLKSVGAKSSTDDARAGDEGAGAPES